MSVGKLLKICNLCREMDRMAEQTYATLSTIVGNAELRDYWTGMADEEAGHVAFWEVLIPLAEQDMIPEIFDDPGKIIVDLEHNYERARGLVSLLEPGITDKDAFIIAFRLEYYLLHPVFEAFFSYVRELRPVADLVCSEVICDGHIEKLITAMGKFCGSDPAMELLGDLLRSLWEENRQLARAINVDSLTGLMNRRGFFNAARPFLDLARRDGKNIGLILADMDDFSGYNDRAGHEAGDALLKSIGLVLRQVVRSSDLVARFGGEEFVVLFYALSEGNLADVAEKMRRTINACSQGGYSCTASVGAASLESPGPEGAAQCANLEEVLSLATRNLEEAKKKGRNRVVVS